MPDSKDMLILGPYAEQLYRAYHEVVIRTPVEAVVPYEELPLEQRNLYYGVVYRLAKALRELPGSAFVGFAPSHSPGEEVVPVEAAETRLLEENPEAIFAEVFKIREQRTKQYSNTRVTAHDAYAKMLGALFECHYRITLPHEPPAHLGALALVLLKVQRASVDKPVLLDDFLDMINYSAIAHECAVKGDTNE